MLFYRRHFELVVQEPTENLLFVPLLQLLEPLKDLDEWEQEVISVCIRYCDRKRYSYSVDKEDPRERMVALNKGIKGRLAALDVATE